MVVWVGRLGARASNCRRQLPFIDVAPNYFERPHPVGSCIGYLARWKRRVSLVSSVGTPCRVHDEPGSPRRVPLRPLQGSSRPASWLLALSDAVHLVAWHVRGFPRTCVACVFAQTKHERMTLALALPRPAAAPPAPSRGSGGRQHAGVGRRAVTSCRNATWLILPVVICLSQRLSHACVSMN